MRLTHLTALLVPVLFFLSCSSVSEEDKKNAKVFLEKSDKFVNAILEADSVYVSAVHLLVNSEDSIDGKGHIKNEEKHVNIKARYNDLLKTFTTNRDSIKQLLNRSKQYNVSKELNLFCSDYEKIISKQYTTIRDSLIAASKKKKKKITIELILDDAYTADSILNVRLKSLNTGMKKFKDKYE